jgi:hypothetical protein
MMSVLRLILDKIFGDPPQPVDVATMLDERANGHIENTNWRTSIVDLMKLLDLDSSYENRLELARELDAPTQPGNPVAMNLWLHREVMRKLAENGGKVPDDLKG